LNTVLEVGINILSKKINEAILQSLSHWRTGIISLNILFLTPCYSNYKMIIF
jgi:hypothetical protein